MIDSFGRLLIVDGTYPAGRLACESVFETALATTNSTAFSESFENGDLWGGPWSDEVDAMPRDLRMLHLTDWLLYTRKRPRSLAVHRWFVAVAHEYNKWLKEIGASDSSRYVGELVELYPNAVPFEDEQERDRHMTTAENENPEIWRDLRARFPALEDELAASIRPMLKSRGAAICRECEALRARFAAPMPRTLRDIVETPSTDAEFSDALTGWLDAPMGQPALGFEDQPEMGRMLWVLDALNTSLVVSGMSHFLYSVRIGRYFPKLAIWAKRVGAPTTVAYAKAASAELKALNGGTLPSMVDAKRIATMHELEEHDEAAGGRGLFDALDQEYRVLVTAELSQRLRAYVREHVEDIERELFAAVEAHRAKS